ncbi:periplasmic chaperone for outer membrane proteins SurA [Albidovulum inexpectatum]|uniref:Parvulin-like PPIase n=1 Tax=Albidovulum inexpectatum TaxID=196587 RepID=A0A2S5JJH2_9RHOB|nr:peptidylprolyl isomerase [Albidovulum inexpectatum]PPB81619.1 periplasmic chaperone for outer membrane proteins SurA [Albidovulum inexpectatum]
MIRQLILGTLASIAFMTGTTAQAGPFSPAITVNDSVITEYELDQRVRFLTLLGAPGDVRELAERDLINDRLRLQAARDLGITLSEQQIRAGMEEFASRVNLTPEQFIQAIGQGGVAPETFRDFVQAGLVWRDVVRARFLPRVSISETEIDRALSLPAQRGAGPRVLLSEIILPVTAANQADQRDLALQLAGQIRTEAQFAEAARNYSAAPSRENGGRIGWIPLTNLPPQARQVILQMGNGQVSPPIPVGNAIAIFRLRGIQNGGKIAPGAISVEYAQALLPTDGSAVRIAGAVDTCDDLYRVLPAESVTRQTVVQTALPRDIADELASLDDNEISTRLRRGNATVLLMLCRRSATLAMGEETGIPVAAPRPDAPAVNPELGFGQGPSRDQVREELTNQRLAALAAGYLEELRANAIIVRN